MSIFILLLALAIWGIVHSFLASHFAKGMISLKTGGADFYRLTYNVFALISFAPILYLMRTLPDQPIYQVASPWNLVMFGGQLFALLMLLIAFLQTDSLSFVGLRQLFEKETTGALVTRGMYRIVRHPLYTFGLLFIWLTSTMTQNSLTVYCGATLYILIGTYFEERKLLLDFGEAYAEYQRKTPMLIPGLVLGRK
ncbi:MAG TPA: isoprenylcysteine carboxylmethyltransferase family protein [Anaerolineales bacterium]|nr:isoprenylcysteine carboxylmethyltransferase family protein [Anaerolineales bacterium]HMX18492.1 isoprenylcysteine carboxylmethyltransferase family protein [Anaerolineales bacterium]HMX72687.1 isoprenylcysteine carboxylmethyltransferase family protein [Anaerolineales bacterium]HMZ44581.1 isoprenylcysteine carboxylmethyltransferase family protein [Anaerolineales bacterium]HNA54479.1 isoprenylcysteine carboxylmethyltransferase family protein [Anaerolineales bacterium]